MQKIVRCKKRAIHRLMDRKLYPNERPGLSNESSRLLIYRRSFWQLGFCNANIFILQKGAHLLFKIGPMGMIPCIAASRRQKRVCEYRKVSRETKRTRLFFSLPQLEKKKNLRIRNYYKQRKKERKGWTRSRNNLFYKYFKSGVRVRLWEMGLRRRLILECKKLFMRNVEFAGWW